MTAAKMPSTNAAGTSRVLDPGLRQELESELGTQHGRTEVHDHDNTVASISRDNGLCYGGRVRAETII